MKKLLFFIGLMVIALNAFNQTDYSVDELPQKTTISGNATEYLYILDGATDKHILLVTILNVAKDSVDALQAIMNDSLAAHWAAIQGGGGAWAKTGTYVYLTDLDDSVGIGLVTPLYKLHVNGNGKIDTLYASHVDVDGLAVGNTGTGGILTLLNSLFADDNEIYWQNNSSIIEIGNELYFSSYAAGTYSLSQLVAAGYTFQNGIYKSGNTVKLGQPLTENTTINLGNYTLDFEKNGVGLVIVDDIGFDNSWRIYNTNKQLVMDNTSTSDDTVNIAGLQIVGGSSPWINYGTCYIGLSNEISLQVDGKRMIWDGDYLYLNNETDTAATRAYARSIGGSGTVTISGTPSLNQITAWASASSIKGLTNFTWESGTSEFLMTDKLTVKNDNGFVVQDATEFNMIVANKGAYSQIVFDADTIYFQLQTENGGMVFWGDKANSGDTCWMVFLPHGSGDGWIADTAQILFSGWASYKENIGEFEVFFATRDEETGEWNWQRWQGDSYHKGLNPKHAFNQLQIAIEKNFVWDNEVRQSLDSLKTKIKKPQEITIRHETKSDSKLIYLLVIAILGLIVWNTIQQKQINKLKR